MKTILVADDEFDLTRTLKALLEGEGYRVEAFNDGRQLLESLKESKPCLVLLDVMMPTLGGLEALRTMKNAPETSSIPVILMSAVPPADRRERNEWDIFLRKPFTIEVLMQTVERLIGKPERAAGV